MAYAVRSKVPISQSKNEIENMLTRFGATGQMFATQPGKALVVFELKGLRIRFILPLPIHKESSKAALSRHEQELRSRWRALLLCIKAKLESIESGITTIEQEFLAHIVLPNTTVIGDWLIPQIQDSYKNQKMPPLLPGGN